MAIFTPTYSWTTNPGAVPEGYQSVIVGSPSAGNGGTLELPSVNTQKIGVGHTITIIDPANLISQSNGIKINPNNLDSGFKINGEAQYISYVKGVPVTLTYVGNGSWLASSGTSLYANVKTIYVNFEGGGSTIPGSLRRDLAVQYDMEIISWFFLADTTGSIEVDIWRDSYANFPPTSLDSIVGTSGFPAITLADKNVGLPTGWTSTSLLAGDILRFNVNSASSITRATLALKCTLTS